MSGLLTEDYHLDESRGQDTLDQAIEYLRGTAADYNMMGIFGIMPPEKHREALLMRDKLKKYSSSLKQLQGENNSWSPPEPSPSFDFLSP